MKQIIGIGNALVDALYTVEGDSVLEEFGLRKGAMYLIDDKQFDNINRRMANCPKQCTTGGSACNTILALATLGLPTGLIGKVCDDENGRFFSDSFHALGVHTYLLNDVHPTGVASTFITPDGQRTFGTYLGAAALLDANEVREEWLDGYAYIYIEGYLVQSHELIERTVDAAHRAGLQVCLDMASFNIVEADRDFFAHLLTKTDIVFANEEEARAFTGEAPEAALDALARICRTVVVKVGAQGAMARCGNERACVPAGDAPRVVDTTAAGDYFAAGFLYAHALGRPLTACLEAGTVLANEIIQVVGTKLPDATWDKIKAQIG